MKDKRRKVTVIGCAMTKPASFDYRDYRQYAAEPVFNALDGIGLSTKDVEIFSVAYNERTIPDAAISPLMADALGGLNAPVVPVSSACAGGGVASFNMYNYISSGRYDIGVCVSFSQTDLYYPMETASASGNFTDLDYALGITHFHYSYLREVYYQEKFGTDDLKADARWAWQDHWYARRNPEAIRFGSPMPNEKALFAQGIQGIRTRSAAGRSQACALIFASEDVAKQFNKPVYIDIGLGNRPAYLGAHFHYPHPDHQHSDISRQPGTAVAARRAMDLAEVTVDDIDIFQVHDLTPADGYMQMEAIGVAEPGQMPELVLAGETGPAGRYPTNTDGGALGFGHSSVGGDFHSKIIENIQQLRGESGERQVENAQTALAQAYGTHQSVDAVGIVRRCF
jgi:acetyl-CoA C-acetyltransferase